MFTINLFCQKTVGDIVSAFGRKVGCSGHRWVSLVVPCVLKKDAGGLHCSVGDGNVIVPLFQCVQGEKLGVTVNWPTLFTTQHKPHLASLAAEVSTG